MTLPGWSLVGKAGAEIGLAGSSEREGELVRVAVASCPPAAKAPAPSACTPFPGFDVSY